MHTTVFQAEIIAINEACKKFIDTKQSNMQYIKIFSDSQAAILALNSITVTSSLVKIFVYLDDILVASPNPATQQKLLHELFQLLEANGININRKKYVFGLPEVRYLGHLVNATGICPLPSRVEDVKAFPTPVSKKGTQRFLGMINYYRSCLLYTSDAADE